VEFVPGKINDIMSTFKKVRIRSTLLTLALLASSCFTLLAQTTAPKTNATKQWHWRIEPYMMFPNMNGQTGVEGLTLADVDASVGDIFSRLQFGAMLSVDAYTESWAISNDFLFMNLKQDVTPTTLINSGRVNMKQLGWELAGFRRINPWLELGIGGLLNSLEVDMTLNRNQVGGGVSTISGQQSKTWYDPMLIARLTTPASMPKFRGQFRAEIGGFGIGSDLAWQIQAMAGYRFSRLFDLTAGYRVISLDYSSGEGAATFVYDMVTFGPMIRFGFTL
jgi:hypothetical protein